MNKQDLIAEMVGKVGIAKKGAQNVIDAFIETVTSCLSKGEKVTLIGFGTFKVMQRKARKGVNPQTKEAIEIPAKKVPKFVPGKDLREKVGKL